MRHYIRHPTSIPIQVSSSEHPSSDVLVNNLSEGGLCFFTHIPVKVGSVVDLMIPYINPDYQCEGVIVWRRSQPPEGFEVGVRFASDDDFFRVRMVEQICQIETYRRQLAEIGRQLTPEEAAQEWIRRYAADFDNDKDPEHSMR